ncbi:FecR family protein [Lysobacter gummosus]|uniref:FecR domain-containing protein n=1 Tax=Lysobacter gummosus TaxID=262324 RepID=A0ABY3XE31_9GAMM|nr:FecR domain-containing protein [Lysobacter gummosus]ALN93762.1 fecR family protein [Lysobacter gummosus]UNP29196.1 FecR domain-containing protein [Lysobacter gummosus]
MNVSTLPPSHRFPDSAEGWLARLLSPESDTDDFAAFEEWIAVSPQNALAYAEAERVHGMARASQAVRAQVPTDLSQIALSSKRPSARRARPAVFAWAAVLVLALVSGWGVWVALRPSSPVQYATAVGERLKVDLPDGSTLVLDTDTALQLSYRRSRRGIELLRGRLQANVAHDKDRPFIVSSGDGSVRAVGTVFQVENRGGDTVVRLLEGRVVVATRQAGQALELHPMQQVVYGENGWFGTPEGVDRIAAEGWTQGRLIFKERRLAELLVEFNRYSRDHLVLSKAELGDIRVSGAFAADDRSGLIMALQRGWGLQAKRTASDETTLYLRE